MPKTRGNKNKPVGSVLHIFCEGKTELNYLKGYVEKMHPLKRSFKREDTKKNTPLQLVEEAIYQKQKNPASDEYWVVYDRESQSDISDEIHQQAIDKASAKKIDIAITNICFELWLLLHFQPVSAPYTSFDNLWRESNLKKELKEIGIDKDEIVNPRLFNSICTKIPDARIRAAKMNAETIKAATADDNKPHRLNPYTRVHKLLDAIDVFAGTVNLI